MILTPCLYCDKRTITCHSTCEEYCAYDQERQRIRKRRQEEVNHYALLIDRAERMRSNHRRRPGGHKK